MTLTENRNYEFLRKITKFVIFDLYMIKDFCKKPLTKLTANIRLHYLKLPSRQSGGQYKII